MPSVYLQLLFANPFASRENYKEALMFALVNGVASSLTIFQACASFYVGAVLLSQDKTTVLSVFR